MAKQFTDAPDVGKPHYPTPSRRGHKINRREAPRRIDKLEARGLRCAACSNPLAEAGGFMGSGVCEECCRD